MLTTKDYIKERDAVQKKIADNEAENKKLRLQLAPLNKLIAADGDYDPNVESDEWEYPCNQRGCDRVFGSAQALGVHRAKIHGIKGGSKR